MRNNIILYSFLMILLFLSCQSKLKTREQVYTYIQDQDNGVLHSRENNGINITISYIPSSLMLGNRDSIQIGNYRYFRLMYQVHDKDMLSSIDQNSYSLLLSRLSFRLEEYLTIRYNGKDEMFSDYQFSPMYGMTNSTEVILAIEKEKLNNEKDLIIKLKDIGLGLPEYSFHFSRNDLDRLDDLSSQLEIKD